MIFNRHARAVRDAKDFARLVAQFDLPYAIELNHVEVAASPLGRRLLEIWQAETDKNEPLILFDEDGSDRRYKSLCRPVAYKKFNGFMWLFTDVTEHQKDFEDFEGRVRHLEAYKRVLSEIMNNFSFPVWVQGENHQILYANQKYDELFAQGTPQAVKDVVKDAMKSPEFSMRTTPAIVLGERKQLEIKVQPLGHGRTLAWTADRTQMMEEIAARSRMLAAQRTLFEQLHTAVATFDENQVLTFYNTAYAKLWDLEEAYLNNKPKLGDILERLRTARYLPEQSDFKAFKNEILAQFTGLLTPLEEMMYLPDGRTLRLLTVPNPAGGLLITFEDVTSTLQLESSVNTLLAVQRETLDNMTEAMAVFGGDGRLKLWNPQYAQMWGLFPEDLNNEPHITAIVDKKVSQFSDEQKNHMRPLVTGMALQRLDKSGRLILSDGRHINYIAVPLPDGATLLSYDDVTDAHQIEQALRDKAAALEAAEKLKLDFLANVSYQLRTPLSAITGFAELLEHQYFGLLNEKQMEYAQGITEAGQRLLSLVDDILDLSTIEAGYMEMSHEVIDVRLMVSGIYHLTEEWARKAQHVYTLHIEEKVGNIIGDERRLKQAMLNLIRNAINFTPRGGSIDITVHRDGSQIIISVKDSGVGIAAADQERIFASFAKADGNEMSQNEGAGLGLSLVKSIVELNKGVLQLNSSPGKGTEISMILPVQV